MSRLAPKVILHAPPWDSPLLESFVARCITNGVRLICVLGPDCERVHDVIDEIIIGDGTGEGGYGMLTTWHTGESIEDVRKFARTVVSDNGADGIEEVRL